jgi:hypothetical protein
MLHEMAAEADIGDVILGARRLAVVSGAAVVVLFGVGSAIWGLDMPEDGTSVGAVAAFYRDTADRIVVGGSLSLLAIAAFVLFAAAVRRLLVDAADDDVLATTAFGGAVLGMAAALGAESINLVAALRARDGELSDPLAQSLFETSQILGSTASGVGLGVFALATAAVALRTGLVLPRAPAIATAAIGVVVLSPLSHVNWVAGAALVVIAATIAAALAPGSFGSSRPR